MKSFTFALFIVASISLCSGYIHGPYYNMRVQICNGSPSLHGMWPQWAESCQANSFDVNNLSPIISQMRQYWASCQGSMTNEQFWAHEWEKHGSCSGMSQYNYFSTVLNLFQQYGMSVTSETNICFTKQLAYESCPTYSTYNDADADGDSDSYMSDLAKPSSSPSHTGTIVAVVICSVVVSAAVVLLAVRLVRRRRAPAAFVDETDNI